MKGIIVYLPVNLKKKRLSSSRISCIGLIK